MAALTVSLLAGLLPAAAQVQRSGASAAVALPASGPSALFEAEALDLNPNLAEPEPKMPGWNLSLIFAPQHDSASGWSTSLTPAIGFRINKYFSFDASTPIYTSINVANPSYNPNAAPKKLVSKDLDENGEFGDTTMAAHAELSDSGITYVASASLTAPSGNSTYGLGTGYVGWNFTNHLEREIHWFSPEFDFGIGNSSILLNRRVAKKTYTSHGNLVNVQGGFLLQLPKDVGLEIDGYGAYPIGSQMVAAQVAAKSHSNPGTVSAGDAEDNGANVSIDYLIHPHLAASIFYSRSQYLRIDTVGMTLTFLLRAPKLPKPAAQ